MTKSNKEEDGSSESSIREGTDSDREERERDSCSDLQAGLSEAAAERQERDG